MLQEYRFALVECGYYHSSGITEEGKVYMWGKGCQGQLGLGD